MHIIHPNFHSNQKKRNSSSLQNWFAFCNSIMPVFHTWNFSRIKIRLHCDFFPLFRNKNVINEHYVYRSYKLRFGWSTSTHGNRYIKRLLCSNEQIWIFEFLFLHFDQEAYSTFQLLVPLYKALFLLDNQWGDSTDVYKDKVINVLNKLNKTVWRYVGKWKYSFRCS
jgi:hypothetical protein